MGKIKPVPKLRKPLTRKGQKRLADEHEELVKRERPKILDGIATAAAEGDRSENAEYIYGRKRLRELDKRIRYLNSVLKDAQIIDPELLSGDRVCFGASVVVLDDKGQEKKWMLVGDGETDYKAGKISWKSPVARALFGKLAGDIVLVNTPSGESELEILGITFEDR